MMTMYQEYLAGLAAHLPTDVRALFATLSGAQESDITELLHEYPDSSEDLLGLLRQIKGTYFQQHQDKKVFLPVLGADVEGGEYPYYLQSAQQILEERKSWFGQESIMKIYDGQMDEVDVDERIDPTVPFHRWLCFAHCINNGGTSRLYIDFSPSPKGKSGQIVRYLHDPDSYQVIADNFAQYLQDITQNEYPFIDPDAIGEEYCTSQETC
ncbi:TPA: SMI1/KNR4 family protein [Escherichia coli]|uniref:SMI1/KNR4 family protein n=1 Tax=Escherichia coli TaxID=562 RepID=UPI001BCDFBDE|nr:SMI1/KNR4 family protein [Escherichia coli]EHU9025117.1 SMI1/KNR4 family protein [Escherichia coli]MBS8868455.1 SMI1/KNR4 family protein [Escherichia coli]MDS1618534.1 SMI1/KNR4 family protein [Escherichia coli]HBD5085159.1 SMI1/KNR4 family protein [Escherichia coli]HBD5325046.1 SMI1/KNR4 family protein [Escherichia coli]